MLLRGLFVGFGFRFSHFTGRGTPTGMERMLRAPAVPVSLEMSGSSFDAKAALVAIASEFVPHR